MAQARRDNPPSSRTTAQLLVQAPPDCCYLSGLSCSLLIHHIWRRFEAVVHSARRVISHHCHTPSSIPGEKEIDLRGLRKWTMARIWSWYY